MASVQVVQVGLVDMDFLDGERCRWKFGARESLFLGMGVGLAAMLGR